MKRAIFYDTETTGIKPGVDRVVEIAAYDPHRDRSFVSLINPEIPIPREASQIHKIFDEMVKDAPRFGDIIPDFIDFIGEDAVLIAHNNDAFDFHFLKAEWKRAGLDMPPWRFIDTLKWARKYRPDLPRHSLQFLRECFGIEANNAHRALDDVIVLHKVFTHLIDDLPYQTVLELLSAPTKLTHMPFGKHQGKLLNEVPKDYVLWLDKSGALQKAENHALRQAFDNLGHFSKPVVYTPSTSKTGVWAAPKSRG